jgi:hypothetical protein
MNIKKKITLVVILGLIIVSIIMTIKKKNQQSVFITLTIAFTFLLFRLYLLWTSFGLEEKYKKILCRYNALEYFRQLNSSVIKVIHPENLQMESLKIDQYPPNTIIVIIDHQFASCDLSAQNFNNFLDNPNIVLCLGEDWLGPDHQKLVRWPVGLESKMVIKHPNTCNILLDLMDKPNTDKKGTLCNAHFATYPNPRSGYRDDRQDMINSLNQSKNIDFWEDKKTHKTTLNLTKSYQYALCPEGNALDTHRFYESYAMGAMPVIRKGPLTSLHSQFPGTVVVNDWKDSDNLPLQSFTNPNKEMLTLGYWLYKSLRSRCRILTFFTGNLCHEWSNLLHTIRQFNLEDLLITFVLDKDALKCAKKEKIAYRTDFMSDNLPGDADFGTKDFRDITVKKLQSMYTLLEEGYFVFYLDTDIVLLQNPIKNYFTLPPNSLYMQSDSKHFKKRNVYYCAGVMFAVPTTENIEMFKKAKEDTAIRPPHQMDDQGAINDLIVSRQIGLLDPAGYPNGHRYFQEREKCWETPVLIHNNFIIGLDKKVARFKSHGLWFV